MNLQNKIDEDPAQNKQQISQESRSSYTSDEDYIKNVIINNTKHQSKKNEPKLSLTIIIIVVIITFFIFSKL